MTVRLKAEMFVLTHQMVTARGIINAQTETSRIIIIVEYDKV